MPIKISFLGIIVLTLILSGCITMTPLTNAAKDGNISTMNALLDKGANVNEVSSGRWSSMPLHWALVDDNKNSYEVVKLLISKGADVNARNSEGQTPLILAATNNRIELCKILVNAGALVNVKDNNGISPLNKAAEHTNVELVKYFFERGADVGDIHKNGYDYLWHAVSSNNPEMIDFLIEKGVDINEKDNAGISILMVAAMSNDIDMAKHLIIKGADVFAYDRVGYTAFSYAQIYKHYKAAKLIKDAEQDIEVIKRSKSFLSTIVPIFHKVSNCMGNDKDYNIKITEGKYPKIWIDYTKQELVIEKSKTDFFNHDATLMIIAYETAHDLLGHFDELKEIDTISNISPLLGLIGALSYTYSDDKEAAAYKVMCEYCEKCFGITKEKRKEIIQNITKMEPEKGGFLFRHKKWLEYEH